MSAPDFSLGINFKVENWAENEYLSDKTQLTEQEVNIFVEEQRNQKTVKKNNSDVSKCVKFIHFKFVKFVKFVKFIHFHFMSSSCIFLFFFFLN